jgi:Phosphoesterase family
MNPAMNAKPQRGAARLGHLRRRAVASIAVLAAASAATVSIASTSASASPAGEPSTSAPAAAEPTSIEPTLRPTPQAQAAPDASPETTATHADDLGIAAGKIKHVWLIILENKSFDATFTGLNKNTYLWETLPSQGVLLKNYYGTGHFSLDNYISMVSGQATQPDTQSDCPFYDKFSGTVDFDGTLKSNPDYGQVLSPVGPNAAAGSNGCVYPADVPTLFNQLDAAGVNWKGYAQDLGNPDESGPTHDAGTEFCGAPYPEPGPRGSTAFPNPGSANGTDQYVPKHFPFPWFESIRDAGDCNEAHIANLFSPTNGLYHDLQSAATAPAFSWITPNNCSDGHDAVCHGNNLSGGFKKGTPLEEATQPNEPVNFTGGLHAADLFLEHVVPEIEESPAFKEGGLIDVTFDEGFPPFTYTGDSFANSTLVAPDAQASVEADSAGENLFGENVNLEPTGPNTPLAKNEAGEELFPGPGDNAFVDRPSDCVAQTEVPQPAGTCLLGGGEHVPGARTDKKATAPEGSSTISDNSIVATDKGRSVSGTGIPAGSFVGEVNDPFVNATAPNQAGGFVDAGSFTLVDENGEPVLTTAPVSGITLGARTPQTDPLFDATDATTGGGDTGSVLIGPYITPGSVSTVYYNHYSWLRTMEDLFRVAKASPGLDHKGHIGYAAQLGLAPFGPDVFNNPKGVHEPKK